MMIKLISRFLVLWMYFLVIPVDFAQTPDLGTTSSYALFTAVGAFGNTGASMVTGDIGTNVGAFSGFPPGTVIGNIHVANPASTQAATDVDVAYGFLSMVTCGTVIATTMGSGQMLTPDIYCLGAASTINGDLLLDGMGDANSVFIFKIDGALATTANSRVILTNSASLCNVYWQVNGEVNLGPNSEFRGTLLVNGAINLLDAASLDGRGLSRSGAISMQNNNVNLPPVPTPAVIAADGPTSLCAGDTLILSGNTAGGIWSTGLSSTSIAVTTAGDYYVTNSNDCGISISNHITVTISPAPVCSITGNLTLCMGQSTQLCVAAGSDSYLWNTGATTNCITVGIADTYSVTITDAGCSSVCSATVTVSQQPVCSISGNLSLCAGQSTQLCVPAGSDSYLWSTGATTDCITVSAADTYSVTITNGACTSVCSTTVTESQQPVCNISGNLSLCAGQSTQLCVPAGADAYLWSTGATTDCITVSAADTYSVTITNGSCTNSCNTTVTIGQQPEISCPAPITVECFAALPPCVGSEATVTDNCMTYDAPICSLGLQVGDDCGGSIAKIYTISDNTGNSVSCIQVITIAPPSPAFDTPFADDLQLPCNVIPQISSLGWTRGNGPCQTTGQVQSTITGSTANCEGFVVERWEYTDACSVTIFQERKVFYKIDEQKPVLIGVPANILIHCGNDLPPWPVVTAVDNCGQSPVTRELLQTDTDCGNTVSYERIWTAVDECGNIATAKQKIEFIDTRAPVLDIPNDTIISCLGSIPEPAYASSDECSGYNVVFQENKIVHNPCEFTMTRTWTATDGCNNIAQKSQTIQIVDTTAPVIEIINPMLKEITLGGEISMNSCKPPQVSTDDIRVTDCCGEYDITTYDRLVTHGKCKTFGYYQKWRCGYIVTDLVGNSAEFYFYLLLYDTMAPILNDVPADTTIICGQSIPPLDHSIVTAEDNCSARTQPTVTEELLIDTSDWSQVLLRKWYFEDDCGNSAEAYQIITLCDFDTTESGLDSIPEIDTTTTIDTTEIDTTTTIDSTEMDTTTIIDTTEIDTTTTIDSTEMDTTTTIDTTILMDTTTVTDTSIVSEPMDSTFDGHVDPPVTIDSTGLIVHEPKYISHFEVYPNPTRHMLHIRFDIIKSGNVQIKLLSKIGTILEQQTRYFAKGNNPHSFDISSYPNGLYWILMISNDDVQYKSVFKID